MVYTAERTKDKERYHFHLEAGLTWAVYQTSTWSGRIIIAFCESKAAADMVASMMNRSLTNREE